VIQTARGIRYADFLWKAQRTVGESDGIAKYDAAGTVIRAEKLRHADIEDAGHLVARWIWDEIWRTPDLVVARIIRTFGEAAKRFGLPR
jgi:very-short-patch-repair endonuclease